MKLTLRFTAPDAETLPRFKTVTDRAEQRLEQLPKPEYLISVGYRPRPVSEVSAEAREALLHIMEMEQVSQYSSGVAMWSSLSSDKPKVEPAFIPEPAPVPVPKVGSPEWLMPRWRPLVELMNHDAACRIIWPWQT